MPYINGIGLISPQKTVDTHEFLTEIMEYQADFLKCIEPVYKKYIDPIQSRRMSRLIKMGIASAKISLMDAGCDMPDAIITGTGLGSVEETEKILGEISKDEKFLNPTPFIQSTYNTISSQIAIQLKCHNYNSTYVHRNFSFENGLLDALMLMEEGMAQNILVGGIDEMTFNHLQIIRRVGQWKKEPVNNLKVREYQTPGALAGEGAAFFTLGKEKTAESYAELLDVLTLFDIEQTTSIPDVIERFLEKNNLSRPNIDLLILGVNGDIQYDPVYCQMSNDFFPGVPQAWFKHLCGEYYTATGFALYAAANILKRREYPPIMQLNDLQPSSWKNILIYNQLRNINHALMLVRAIS
ncbi:MAG: beta-ketoacyl synthase chain length factor [Bacteroidales bacterium]|nr:beta-ketoacyl synthase chain length factor [Bacteroidales bacterium]